MEKIRLPIEVLFSASLVIIMLIASAFFHLPIRMPDATAAKFVGVHYLYPLGLALIGGIFVALQGRRAMIGQILTYLPCYTAVLFAHFHIKLWASIINPYRYDDFYWNIDQTFRPLIDFCFQVQRTIAPLVPYQSNFYMLGFIMMFWVSIGYHALRTPHVFRTLFLAMLFIQGLGALFYLIAPAIGPFIYEPGLNPYIGQSQHYMLAVHDAIGAQGAGWLSANESQVLLTGLGAMPSLHVGCSFLFLWFAVRHGRALLPVYIPVFAYIVTNAIASRWHYLIDLPVGMLLAYASIALAHKFTQVQPEHTAAEPEAAPAYAM